MTVGLIRSERASDSRTLEAILRTPAGYVAAFSWSRSSALNSGISALSGFHIRNLAILLVGMPLVATAAAWLLSGRLAVSISRQPAE
jgi:hypothetical protein